MTYGKTIFGAAAALILSISAMLDASVPAQAQPEWRAPPCLFSTSPDKGGLCIRAKSYSRDICTALEHFSSRNALPNDFFARLIWKESLFRPDAVSYKGAEGIAQFMPSTARMRGLANSFDPLQALDKSAEYLAALRDRFGNLGLAAAAYNAGEAGLEGFLRTGNLPFETRAYVIAVTAHPVEDWKNNPPDKLALPLDEAKPFHEACTALAETRNLKEIVFAEEGPWAPWGAQLAAHFQKPVAERLFMKTVARMPAPFNAEKPLIQRERNRAFGSRLRYTARIARQTRAEADAVCVQVRKSGGACIVFKN